MERRKLYLDVDGVLLGKRSASDVEIVLAGHVAEFLEYALRSFDCYWLTTHCRGDAKTVLDYLRPHCPIEVMGLLAEVKPTSFRTLKTEAMSGDFIWLDDAPLAAEVEWLLTNELLHRWIEVDTRKRPDDLLRAMQLLKGQAPA